MTRGVIRHLHPLDLTDDAHLESECKGLLKGFVSFTSKGAKFTKLKNKIK